MIEHDMITKNLIADAVCGELNAGSIIFLTDANLTVATILLDVVAFALSVSGQAIANSFPKSATVTTTGTVTKFQILDNLSVVKISGTVTIEGSGGDIELVGVNYSTGDTLTLNSLYYRVPH